MVRDALTCDGNDGGTATAATAKRTPLALRPVGGSMLCLCWRGVRLRERRSGINGCARIGDR